MGDPWDKGGLLWTLGNHRGPTGPPYLSRPPNLSSGGPLTPFPGLSFEADSLLLPSAEPSPLDPPVTASQFPPTPLGARGLVSPHPAPLIPGPACPAVPLCVCLSVPLVLPPRLFLLALLRPIRVPSPLLSGSFCVTPPPCVRAPFPAWTPPAPPLSVCPSVRLLVRDGRVPVTAAPAPGDPHPQSPPPQLSLLLLPFFPGAFAPPGSLGSLQKLLCKEASLWGHKGGAAAALPRHRTWRALGGALGFFGGSGGLWGFGGV